MAKTVSNLDEQVKESLRTRIVSGDLSGGAHLSELKLSKEFNVSRTPIREALCALAADGLIEMVPHRGAFVRNLEVEEKADQHFVYNQIVSMASRISAERAGIEEMLELENTIGSMDTSSTEKFVGSAQKVHSLILKIANSPTLNVAIETIERRMISETMWLDSSESIESIQKEYTYLLAAFKRQKGDAAEKTMRQIMASLSVTASSKNAPEEMMTMTSSSEKGVELNA